ncbi:MFS transporter [soil metagenome]
MADATVEAAPEQLSQNHALIIGAASLGTIFEWYDFYLYGSLATVIASHFFSGVNETTGFFFALMAFAAGFAVRPFGALVFGRLGDLWGRKNTFLVTMMLMGLSTFVVALLPSYDRVGLIAPIALIVMRLLQGLALGGEYGGAATYVAEHAPAGKRGYYTSWIQTTATLGFFLSLVVILATRHNMDKAAFDDWGWRIPFAVSILLLGVSVWIRLQLNESPIFAKMVAEGKGSKQPLTDSFAKAGNLKLVILALFGLTAGQAVIWYTGQFYVQQVFFDKILKLDADTNNSLVAIALLIAAPGFILFGWLSDKIGRKPVIMAGLLIAVLTYFPIFKALAGAANPALVAATATSPVTVVADPADCSFQFDPIGKKTFVTSCDMAKAYLAKAGVSYTSQDAPAGTPATVKIGAQQLQSIQGEKLDKAALKPAKAAFEKELGAALTTAGYPAKADPARIDKPKVVGLLILLMLMVTMVYGPIAAMLVEMFPTNIRYTSMSLPYHVGNGWFGGFLPATAFAMVAASGNIYFGLWYPVVIAAVTFVIGMLFIKETKNVDITA